MEGGIMDLNALAQLSGLVVAVFNAHADPPFNSPLKSHPTFQPFSHTPNSKLAFFTHEFPSLAFWYFWRSSCWLLFFFSIITRSFQFDPPSTGLVFTCFFRAFTC
ncbi:hypothetical protein I3760_07G064100 [Carya illinoinensis]|uniref:Uncharacterized protein n=1 Tax=Carya illinoinensis TaxID=32201 RepID=A0A922EJM0_CARIL|nr:hypothetical protein I3760_07G064100 [Carya illinoinensis]KAG6703083.1 hypothetical protein I3842_07G066200 [Carya illinoinensis]